MLRILFDQNFNHRIVRGLRRKLPEIDDVTTQALGKERNIDSNLLLWAFEEKRVVVTHDQKTFPKYTYERILKGLKTYGVIVVPAEMQIGKAIEGLEFLIRLSEEDEFVDQVKHLSER